MLPRNYNNSTIERSSQLGSEDDDQRNDTVILAISNVPQEETKPKGKGQGFLCTWKRTTRVHGETSISHAYHLVLFTVMHY